MKIVWRSDEPVTVRRVYEEMRTHRTVAYTTVLTNMKTSSRKAISARASTTARTSIDRPVPGTK
jgi:predicted transcriptional regulator